MSEEVFSIECWFEGRVQGVGFRYMTSNLSKGFEVSGTVKNLQDGRVHLVVEGDEAEVRAFQAAVADELEAYIRGVELKEALRERTVQGFRIIS